MTPKILFILCNDFGELLIADYFVDGQPLQALALCPEKIFAAYEKHNRDTQRYRNIQDVYTSIEAFKPNLVIFASGYLLSLHNLLSLPDLKQLMQYLREKNIPLVSTDPWMKCWEEFRENLSPEKRTLFLSHPFQQLQSELDDLLKDIPHIYSVPFTTQRVPCVAFFNEKAFSEFKHSEGDEPSRWLFILSAIDFGTFTQRDGESFINNLVARFTDILQKPSTSIVFICPPDCAEIISRKMANTSRITLIPFCRFSEFQRHIFSCDIGVYWNYLSASIIYHLHKGSAMVFADKGHMLTVCPPLEFYVEKHVLNNVNPTNIDLSRPLTQKIVDQSLAIQQQMNSLIYPQYAKLKSPIETVASLLKNH